uniref:hypothetical protein n=1 Tax=Ningiella ruwaisensis TaxID=2364274 RepID=UPI0010A09C48|nr:hypothetical protein [Ningiella ruwaisensis]
MRRFALILVMNAVVLAAMYWVAINYIWTEQEHSFTRTTLPAVLIIIEALLLGLALYFYIRNQEVQIWVSPSEFHYSDPVWGDFGFTVSVNDIVALRQIRSATNNSDKHLLQLKSGETKQIMYQNYSVDRQKLFDALKKANPSIVVPSGPWEYEVTRPQWAKKIREKAGLSD